MDGNWETCAKTLLSFDDKAAVAIYLYADVKFKPNAAEALERFRKICSVLHPELKTVSAEKLEREIGWDGLYNDEVRDLAIDGFGFRTFVDRFGAFCWVDDFGNNVCGDQSGFFPFYADERSLRERMMEGKVVV